MSEEGSVSSAVCLFEPALFMVGSLHEEQSGQVVEKNHSDPLGHAVRSWRLEVPVDDDDGDEDGDDVHDEGEQEVLGNKGDGE